MVGKRIAYKMKHSQPMEGRLIKQHYNIYNQHKRMATIIIIFCFFIVLPSFFSVNITTGIINAGSRGVNEVYDITGYAPNEIIKILFETDKPLTSVSLLVYNSPVLPSTINVGDFYHKDPREQDNYDLDAMWSSRRQYINIPKPNGASNLYFTIINFDPSYRQQNVNYTITIKPPGVTTQNCQSCSNGENYGSNSCFCRNCVSPKIGKVCSRILQNLDKNITVSLTPQLQQYFAISKQDQITVQIQIQGGSAQIYFQFQQFQGEVANLYNVASGTLTDAIYLVSQKLKVQTTPNQRTLLITILSLSNNPINATIGFNNQASVSVLVIVMGILGGILLIALIIAVICIVKKRNSGVNRINSQLQLPSDNSKLTGDEIQRYFPNCKYCDIIAPTRNLQSSVNPIQNKQAPSSQQDCVICLQTIKDIDQIRLGYCKHMFHGACLISWFKKQRNCPYCRKQYNRDQTVAEYNKLVSQNNGAVLKNAALVRAIYQRKLMSKTVIQNLD